MNKKSQFDVVGVGAAVVDYIGVVTDFPCADTQIELQQFSKQTGGNVTTALVTLAKLGVATAYLGKFGDDGLAQHVRSTFKQHKIDISHCKIQAGGSMGFAFIIVEGSTGKRTILWTNEGKPQLQKNEIDAEAILASRYLHLDHYAIDTAIAAAEIAQQGNVEVVLDAESMHPKIDRLLPLVDVLIVCEEFAQQYTSASDSAQALDLLYAAVPAHTVVITAGKQGSYCRNAEQTHRQSPFSIPVVDTTGCGDVYHGAFIYGLLENWPLPRCAEFASAAAALNCRGLGGQSAIPTLAEVKSLVTTGTSGSH